MSAKDITIEEVRRKLILLLEDGQVQFADRALQQGIKWLQSPVGCEWQEKHGCGFLRPEPNLVRFLVDALKSDCQLNAGQLGEPPGSMGTGYAINRADGRDLYVKMKIDEPRF